ncbi:MAG TPA: methionine--tRNA ligase subunit beta [Candidatus Limnocylindria bacterium]|nr:methionine--tRNA ligase subunit beta [Candidatus Limnocylindria bacterium]
MITIDQFKDVELRVATVVAAEPHPNADRLVVLRVDLGTEQRQLVAGIRAVYDPATLVGRQIVVVANLQPAVLRGVESQGMLLAAAGERGPVLVSPEQPVPAGAVVR